MSHQTPPADLNKVTIKRLRAYVVDLPLKRVHKLAMSSVSKQRNIVVELIDDQGQSGWGEVGTMPAYGAEAAETISAVIQSIFAPAIVGTTQTGGESLFLALNQLIVGNSNAKSALCLAMDDLVAKRLNISLCRLWGEQHVDHLPVTWVLGAGDVEEAADEAASLFAQGLFKSFMLKLGRTHPEEDLARVRHVVDRLDSQVELRVDINQRWNLSTALRYIPQLEELGIHAIEQPVAAHDIAAMVQVDRICTAVHVADEAVQTPADALRLTAAGACRGISIKIAKHGSAGQARAVGQIAAAAGQDIFAGTMFESSLGVAAHAQLFATFERLNLGSQFFGPQLMREEIVADPIVYSDFGLNLPVGPGIGVTVDRDRLREFGRELG